MGNHIRRLRNEAGQSIVEYALLIAVVALLSLPAIMYCASQLDKLFSNTAAKVEEEP